MVEGINGAGKSSVAEYITDSLTKGGQYAEWFEESDYEHPADYTFHAYLPNEQIKKLSCEEQVQLYGEGLEVLSGLVIPLTKVSVSLFEKIIPYKIYDKLDWETEKPVMLQRWDAFAKKACAISQIFIFEGSFLQKPICETMIRLDLSQSEIKSYLKAIYQTISKLRPVVIYLQCSDIGSCVETVGQERGCLWLDRMIGKYTSRSYAKNNGLSGKAGYITCLEQRQSLELQLLESIPCTKLVLTDPFDDWEDTKHKLDRFMEN